MVWQSCKNCGKIFRGKFCNACGEKYYAEQDKSLKHLAEETFHFITHLDSKFLITLRSVLFKTGNFSLEYTAGIRKKYFKPVSLFLIVIIAYLLFPFFKGLNMQLNTYVSPKYGYTFISVPVVKAKMKNQNLTYQEVQKQYDEKSGKFSKFLLLLYLPLTALVLSVLFFSQKRFFFDHFILATELNTFFIFIMFLFLPLLMVLGYFIYPGISKYFNDDGIIIRAVAIFFSVIFTIAFRRFYKEKWLWSALKALVFMVAYNFVIKYIYNVILFGVVMFFVK